MKFNDSKTCGCHACQGSKQHNFRSARSYQWYVREVRRRIRRAAKRQLCQGQEFSHPKDGMSFFA